MTNLFTAHPVGASLLIWGASILVALIIVELNEEIRRSSHD